MKPLTLRIFGMDCTACAPELKRILLKQNGVLDAEVSYTSGKTSLTIDETFFDISQTEHAIKRAGFAIPMEHVVLSCNANVNITEIKEKLSALPGIASVTVSESDHTFLLSLYPIGITREDLQQAVSPATLSVNEWNSGEEELEQSDQLSMLRRLFLSVILATPIFWSPAPWIQFVLATVLQFGPGRYFYQRCLRAIYSKQLNMDFLITLSTSIIYIYSTVLTFTVHDNIKLYYLCDGVLMSLIFFGKYLEIIAKGQTSQSIRGLVHLIPQEALCVRDGQEIKIPSDALRPDDIVKIEAGMRIPADGILLDDTCYVDESMLTGESEPVQKGRGEHLTGGSLNRNESIYMKITHTGRNTTLQQMIDMVQAAQSSRAPLQNIVDRIAAIFIPVVLIISLLVFVIWYFWATPYNLSDALLTMCGVLVPKDRKHLIQVLRISHVQKDYTQLVADGFAVSYPRTAGTRRPDYSRAHFSSIEFVSSVCSHKSYV